MLIDLRLLWRLSEHSQGKRGWMHRMSRGALMSLRRRSYITTYID